ncbi:GntR family transcriptional regulator [Dellaglioa carnosa]|uniref:GntR family transcriptional regulator n=1 Tax=Dellaglioa carnosa TaxID=2995136 RepID=UPI0022A8AD01|nr:GntR family transcriptional regulator [Dellaglioa carnosa]MCZ2493550.1 GntR family transcriptional regulator [Dellaglioa carnosa]
MQINKTSSKPFYEQLISGIKEDIFKGILQTDDKVPSVREMAKIHEMNPNTVSKAYKVLESQDVLVTVKGRGTYVKATNESDRDERQIQKVRTMLLDTIKEVTYLGVQENEIHDWIKQYFEKGES